ncbi:ORF MSV210 hypothetical protein [Melanoplus sanguinipes entomopoxvirus]|uniref:Uncharacterized protein n=1 Tax=Melanoplus sanguinipes entomopoxvirus TaxID=83191 RepID=Q9YVN2_MSEPV|nr:ORF MSV210 hypothetical protein [Melanoplus sanguinipes entomopoxvirus]AAC97702.1 ORF MSV210 hypothetical protein [Melanoplus sanguinipes entomopoxvirus 'O']
MKKYNYIITLSNMAFFELEVNMVKDLMIKYEHGIVTKNHYFDMLNIILNTVNNKIINTLYHTYVNANNDDDKIIDIMNKLYNDMNELIFLIQNIFTNHLVEHQYVLKNLEI